PPLHPRSLHDALPISPDLARRIADEGHELVNHTWSHRNLWLCGPRETEREILQGHEAIGLAADTAPRFFRPPWGMTNLAALSVVDRKSTRLNSSHQII